MKKIISIVLMFTVICLNLTVPIYAGGESDVLAKFKEYNTKKISLYLSLVEIYESGTGINAGTNQVVYTKDGRKYDLRDEPEYTNTKYEISWYAFNDDKLLTEEQLYSILGLEEEARKAEEANKNSKSMYYGGIIALGVGFVMLTVSGSDPSSTELPESDSSTGLGAVLTAAGAIAMLIGNKTIAVKDHDFIDVYKLVEKHNLELKKNYFADVNFSNRVKEIDNINTLQQLTQYKQKNMGPSKEEYDNKDFTKESLQKGMTKEEVLANCGYPLIIDQYKALTSYEYLVSHQNNRMFDFGKFIGESYNKTIYKLYFENNVLVNWTEQDYIS